MLSVGKCVTYSLRAGVLDRQDRRRRLFITYIGLAVNRLGIFSQWYNARCAGNAAEWFENDVV